MAGVKAVGQREERRKLRVKKGERKRGGSEGREEKRRMEESSGEKYEEKRSGEVMEINVDI